MNMALQVEMPDNVASLDLDVSNKGTHSYRRLPHTAETTASEHWRLDVKTKGLDILAQKSEQQCEMLVVAVESETVVSQTSVPKRSLTVSRHMIPCVSTLSTSNLSPS